MSKGAGAFVSSSHVRIMAIEARAAWNAASSMSKLNPQGPLLLRIVRCLPACARLSGPVKV